MTAALNSPVRRAGDFFGRRRQRQSKIALVHRHASDVDKNLDDSDTSLDLFEVDHIEGQEESSSGYNRSSIVVSDQSSSIAFNNSALARSRHARSFEQSSGTGFSATLPILAGNRQKPPPKEKTSTPSSNFKIDGVPACVSQQIEENSRVTLDKKNKKKKQKSVVTLAELQNSASSLQTKRQRPQIKFLDLPKDHPLFWDKNELHTADFPEKDRNFLAKILKYPTSTTVVGSHPLSPRVEQILLKLHKSDWDASILGRSAMVLFHPDSNPLGLSPLVTSYFFKRINSLKTNLLMEEMPALEYRGRFFHSKDSLEEFAIMLRKDFVVATRNHGVYQNSIF